MIHVVLLNVAPGSCHPGAGSRGLSGSEWAAAKRAPSRAGGIRLLGRILADVGVHFWDLRGTELGQQLGLFHQRQHC